MIFGDLPRLTTVNYPSKIAFEVFTIGCNLQCGYCHNPELLGQPQRKIDEEGLLNYLEEKLDSNWYDGVCITGGEPTIHEDLPEFIKKLKDLGLAVKLDTNGTNPEMLKELIDKDLVDYIAMDVKTTFSSYKNLVGDVDPRKISMSSSLIMVSDIDYMFRTTVVPGFHDENFILWISYQLEGGKCYQIQNFHNERETLDKKFMEIKPFSKEELEEFRKIAEPYFGKVIVRE